MKLTIGCNYSALLELHGFVTVASIEGVHQIGFPYGD
jgi:hypothetical protein